MLIANEQNLRSGPPAAVRPFGIRIKLRTSDPFQLLLGSDWQKFHWYPTARDRDLALADMSRQHDYSRQGDRPALLFEKVEKLAESRGR